MTASWAVPVIALSVVALRRPVASGPVLMGVTAIAALFTLADSAFGIIPRDAWGPVAAVVMFGVLVVLAFLGLHRAELAGLLMVVAGALGHESVRSGSHRAGRGRSTPAVRAT